MAQNRSRNRFCEARAATLLTLKENEEKGYCQRKILPWDDALYRVMTVSELEEFSGVPRRTLLGSLGKWTAWGYVSRVAIDLDGKNPVFAYFITPKGKSWLETASRRGVNLNAVWAKVIMHRKQLALLREAKRTKITKTETVAKRKLPGGGSISVTVTREATSLADLE